MKFIFSLICLAAVVVSRKWNKVDPDDVFDKDTESTIGYWIVNDGNNDSPKAYTQKDQRKYARRLNKTWNLWNKLSKYDLYSNKERRAFLKACEYNVLKNADLYTFIGDQIKVEAGGDPNVNDFYKWPQYLAETAKKNKVELRNEFCTFWYASNLNKAAIEENSKIFDNFDWLDDLLTSNLPDTAIGFKDAFYVSIQLLREVFQYDYQGFFYVGYLDSSDDTDSVCSWDFTDFAEESEPEHCGV
jgi:hypothetical protein